MSWGLGSFQNKISGAEDDYNDARKKLAQATELSKKTASDFQTEGRAAAGQAAADKAGQAKKQAKAATMQAGGNRLQAATNAAGAAQAASSEGYDTTSNAMTQAAQAQNQAQISSLQAEAAAKQTEAKSKSEEADKWYDRGAQIASSFIGGMASSDSRKKHIYIPKEQRSK